MKYNNLRNCIGKKAILYLPKELPAEFTAIHMIKPLPHKTQKVVATGLVRRIDSAGNLNKERIYVTAPAYFFKA